ncbi:MAG TPA: chloride channel protein [Acidimicrobiales bacterium]|nr:chloride channel protein [Acidimicrobiales bacterium]
MGRQSDDASTISGAEAGRAPEPDPAAVLVSRRFLAVLVLSAVVGVVASLAAWCFLELIHYVQVWVFTDIPRGLGLEPTPKWWYLPVLALAGLITAFAVARLPGRGGHVPVHGLDPTPTAPVALPGVLLAGLASVGLGVVLGPEAPLIALGGGLGFLLVGRIRRETPPELGTLIAASATFAALSFLFGSPIIAAVILLEAAGLDRRRMPLLLVPGLMAAGIGSLVAIGMGAWTGVNMAAITLGTLPLPSFARPTVVDFLWTVAFALVVTVGCLVVFGVGRRVERVMKDRTLVILPVVGVMIAVLAVAFSYLTDKGVDQVLFSGQDAMGPLISDAATWSLGALALLIAFKGLAYSLSLGKLRGGPVFPAMFLGAAAGLMAASLPGYDLSPAVAVGIGAAVATTLRLPLAAVVLATLLCAPAGTGVEPLIIVGVVVAYLTTLAVEARVKARAPEPVG